MYVSPGSFFQQPVLPASSSSSTVSQPTGIFAAGQEIWQACMDNLTADEQQQMHSCVVDQRQQNLRQKWALAHVGSEEEFKAKQVRVLNLQREAEKVYIASPDSRNKRKEIDYCLVACGKNCIPGDTQVIDAFWNCIERNSVNFTVFRRLFSSASLRFLSSFDGKLGFDEAVGQALDKVISELQTNTAGHNEALSKYCALKVKYILPSFLCFKVRAKSREEICERDRDRHDLKIQYKAYLEALSAQRIKNFEQEIEQCEKRAEDYFHKHDRNNPHIQRWGSMLKAPVEECRIEIAKIRQENVDAEAEAMVNEFSPPIQEVSLPEETAFEQIASELLIHEDEIFDSSVLLPPSMQLAESSLTVAYFVSGFQRADDEKLLLLQNLLGRSGPSVRN